MSGLAELSLIRLFNFYLAAIFLIGLIVRVHQYRAILGLVRTFQGRWPKLFHLVKQHSVILLTWRTMLPGLLTFVLLAIHTMATQFIWPTAHLTLAQLASLWPALVVVVLFGLVMAAVDVYLLCTSSTIDRPLLEKYFDQAEYWLRSWTAPVVHFLSLGFVNPRRIVNREVRNALEQSSGMLNTTLWWVTVQTGLRIACGLSLWISYGLARSLFPETFVELPGASLRIAFPFLIPIK
jgi:hypothetical protein